MYRPPPSFETSTLLFSSLGISRMVAVCKRCARAGAGGEQQRAGIVMRVARCARHALAPHEPTQRERGAQRTCVRLPENGGDVYTDSSSRVRESDERAAETARSRGSGELGKTAAWMALQQAAAGRHACCVVVYVRCACVRCWDLTACMRALTLQLSAVTRPSVASDPKNPEKPCKLIHFLPNLPLSERLCRELLARYRALPVRSSSS